MANDLEKAQDRRIVRTRQALYDALIELTEERGLDGFTVNDLCERADLNRGTFYNHFHDKEDLLASFEGEVLEHLEQFRGRMGDISLKDVARATVLKRPIPLLVEVFDYLGRQGEFLHAMLGDGGDASFAARLRDSMCTELVRSLLHERYRNSTDAFVGYYVAFYASAYMGVIGHWIQTGRKESSEDMARIAMRLLLIKPGESIKL